MSELLERLAGVYHCEIHLYSQRVENLRLNELRQPPSSSPEEAGLIFWHKVPSFPAPHLAQFLAWIALNQAMRWWHTHFRGLKYDLVLSPGINCLDANVIIVHALFHRLRELAQHENTNTQAKPGFLRDLHRRAYYALLTSFERRLYSKTTVALATVSQRIAELLQHYFARYDVRVIPNAVDTREFSPAARLARRAAARLTRSFPDSDLVLLLIGNDWRVKGVPAILKAIAACKELPIRLLVAGDDSPAPYRAMASNLGIAQRCHFEPSLSDVIDLYSAADVYVSPSLEDSFGLPVAEAMACGLPVITSAFAGIAGLLRNEIDGLVLEDPQDVDQLRSLLVRLQADPVLRQRLGDAASALALQWTWDRNAAAIWELLKQSAADAPSRPV